MAIIRIKRSTGTNLPTGLTFGELAFVQGSGATANRLYIAGSSGGTAWVGAEILNSPTYWSGLTAQTTLATVSAIENRIVAGGGVTFASNLTVNIDTGKYFGKYTKGDVIPALGQTVKWVIENALSETITPGIKLSISSATVQFGQTANISYTVTPEYQIKTVGATAAGATLEWKRANDANYTSYSGVFYDNTDDPFTTNGTTFTVTAQNGITNNSAWNTNSFQYRYTIHDSAGASASTSATVTVVGNAIPTVSSFAAAASTLLTAETNGIRERGNSYSNITGTINSQNSFVPLTHWKLQYSENGSGVWSDTNKPSAGFQVVTPNSQTAAISTNHTPPTTGLSRVDYRILATDTYQISLGATATLATIAGVSFGYRIFYGPTGSVPTTSANIKTLTGISMASGTNAAPNPFVLNAGTEFKNFVVALPENLTISEVEDLDLLGGQSILASYAAQTDINVDDREGGTKAYNIYVMTQGITYASNHRHQVTRTGTVS